LLVKKGSGIKDFPDLKGRTDVTTAGGTSEVLLRAMNEKNNMGMDIISGKDHAESFLILQSDQSKEAYGMTLPKDDVEFKKVVDEAIAQAEMSGAAEKLYQRWFMSPIPPKGLNLNLPLSDDIKALFKSPNDRPFQ
jgi:ABC-type amino acid transport/signal transduction systems, periplasmic component/domain